MFCYILISALIASSVAVFPKVQPIAPRLDGRIVGGEDTTIEEYPHQLSLEYRFSHICGASILSETRALTAAHCTNEAVTMWLKVRAGSSERGRGGIVVDVKEFFQHPKYSRLTVDYDVTVLALKEALPLGSGITPIPLHGVGKELATGTLGTVTGWGRLCDDCTTPPKVLQKVQLPKVDDAQCQKLYANIKITPRMVCHGFIEGEKDSCQGDSGGPLVAENVQIGIVSWGLGCASPKHPGVYTRIANEQINEYINTHL